MILPPNQPQSSADSSSDELQQELVDINQAAATKYYEYLLQVLTNPDHPVTRYVRGPDRELTDELIKAWQLGYAPDEWQFITQPLTNNGAVEQAKVIGLIATKNDRQYDFFRDRLMIPIVDGNQRTIGFTARSLNSQQPKYLNSPASAVFQKNTVLFGLNHALRSIARQRTVVLTEGIFDVITLHRFGVSNAVGKGGTALTDEQVQALRSMADVVILIYDADTNGAGQRALEKDCERLLAAGLQVQIVELSCNELTGKQDADSWLRQLVKEHEATQKKPRIDVPKFITKTAQKQEGIVWLATTWFEADNIASQVKTEKRITELLARVGDETWLKKYVNRLAQLFSSKPADLLKSVQRIRRLDEETQSEEEETGKVKALQYRSDNSIWIYGNRNWVCVAENFQFFIRYKMENENQEIAWILEIKRRAYPDQPLYVRVIHDEFCSATKLKVKLASCDLAFKVSDAYLSELHQHLFELGYPKAIEVTRLGYHAESGVYFFANKAFKHKLIDPDEHDIVESQDAAGKPLYLAMPQQSRIPRRSQTFFHYSAGETTFNQWFMHMATVHRYNNVVVPACFYLMALFRDVLIHNTNTCPMLYLKGGASSGKSSIVRSICQLFGFKEPAANLKSRVLEAALIRKMSQLSNSVIWLEEMRNDFEYKGVLQAAYDNTGYSRSSDATSIDTNSVDIHSAIAITSNYLLDDDILFTRCVFVPVIEADKTEQQIIDYNKLEELQINGLAGVTIELLKYRSLIETNFASHYQQLLTAIRQSFKNEKVTIRFISNMAQVMTVPYILQLNGKINIMEFTEADEILEEFVRISSETIIRQHHIASEKSNLSEFFEIIQSEYEQGHIHPGLHFRFTKTDKNETILLRFPALYHVYARRYRQTYYKPAVDRNTLREEMLAFEGETNVKEFFGSIRFFPLPEEPHNPDLMRVVSDCCSMNYERLRYRFNLDLECPRDAMK